MSEAKKGPSRSSIVLVIFLAMFVAAPTVGDVGGCGTEAEVLDATKFYTQQYEVGCRRCRDECGWISQQCALQCSKTHVVPRSFPTECSPVVHDGEVCLRALEALSCNSLIDYVDQHVIPTECDFCPVSPP